MGTGSTAQNPAGTARILVVTARSPSDHGTKSVRPRPAVRPSSTNHGPEFDQSRLEVRPITLKDQSRTVQRSWDGSNHGILLTRRCQFSNCKTEDTIRSERKEYIIPSRKQFFHMSAYFRLSLFAYYDSRLTKEIKEQQSSCKNV